MWRYGDSGDRYKVNVGEVWGVGPHRIECLDLESIGFFRFQGDLRSDPPDVVYTDPPWNKGLASSYRTKAGLSDKANFPELWQRIVRLASIGRGSVFVEYGPSDVDSQELAFSSVGAAPFDTWKITYGKKNPGFLSRYSWGNGDDWVGADLSGMDDEDTPSAVLGSYPPGQRVLDMCTGQGLTPLAADKHGHVFVGTELHPRRIANALHRLAKQRGEKPRRIS